MKYINLEKLPPEKFKRLTGVKIETFNAIVNVLREAEKIKQRRGGPKYILSLEDRVLMFLEYLREYRTYAHIAQSRNICESACFRCIRWIENTLIKCKKFSLPGHKVLLDSNNTDEIILIDVTESPIQRPKKNKKISTQERKKDTLSKPKLLWIKRRPK